jgi:hypothetical protein
MPGLVPGIHVLLVPRMQRITMSAFTRVFDALWWCAADPGPIAIGPGSAEQRFTLHRVRDTESFSVRRLERSATSPLYGRAMTIE